MQRGVLGVQLAHQDGLHDALRLDALSQLVERAFVHVGAWLVHAGHHVAEQQRVRLAGTKGAVLLARRVRHGGAE